MRKVRINIKELYPLECCCIIKNDVEKIDYY